MKRVLLIFAAFLLAVLFIITVFGFYLNKPGLSAFVAFVLLGFGDHLFREIRAQHKTGERKLR